MTDPCRHWTMRESADRDDCPTKIGKGERSRSDTLEANAVRSEGLSGVLQSVKDRRTFPRNCRPFSTAGVSPSLAARRLFLSSLQPSAPSPLGDADTMGGPQPDLSGT